MRARCRRFESARPGRAGAPAADRPSAAAAGAARSRVVAGQPRMSAMADEATDRQMAVVWVEPAFERTSENIGQRPKMAELGSSASNRGRAELASRRTSAVDP
jgi:hypothetical protein